MRDALGLSGVVNRAGKASNARSRAGLLEDMHSVFALWTEYGTLRCPQFSLRGAQCARDGWPKAARTGMDGRFAKRSETDVTRHCECMLDRLRYTWHVPSMVCYSNACNKSGRNK